MISTLTRLALVCALTLGSFSAFAATPSHFAGEYALEGATNVNCPSSLNVEAADRNGETVLDFSFFDESQSKARESKVFEHINKGKDSAAEDFELIYNYRYSSTMLYGPGHRVVENTRISRFDNWLTYVSRSTIDGIEKLTNCRYVLK